MGKRIAQLLTVTVALLLLNPRPGLAIPIHGHPHGFFIHQAAHLLMTAAMFFFVFTLWRETLLPIRGFRLLAWASGIFAVWSLEHFVGHWAEMLLVNPVILGHGWTQRLLMDDWDAWLYYITQLDNWMLALSFFFLYRGLKALSRERLPSP